ncbi:MAG: transcriptional regulator [Nitrospirae bacterium]|nr:transcriptional regulator [Nitrospirota bacterium]
MEFIETPIFTRLISGYLSDIEYSALQIELALNPESGDIIQGSGGLRKLRWSGKGKGKRGGLRIIYYWQKQNHEIWLLTIYAKNEAEDISLEILKKIRKEIGK